MRNYKLNKDIVFLEIIRHFPEDFKITSLAENARAFYYYAKKNNIQSSSFFMLGSMGQELSMGLGLSLGVKNVKDKKCIVISSDGSLLSNTNALFTVGVLKPKKLVILALDNEMHRITGKQPTASRFINLCGIAKVCHFKTYLVLNKKELIKTFKAVKKQSGPIFVQIKINDKKALSEKRIAELPAVIFRNFSENIEKYL